MNKREFVEKLKMHGAWCTECHDINGEKDRYVKVAKVRELLEQLDEPQAEKVEVPDFVAEWYEANKEDLEGNIFSITVDIYDEGAETDFEKWFYHCDTKPFETLIRMKDGYTVKSKRWVVKFVMIDAVRYFSKFNGCNDLDYNYVGRKENAHIFTDKSKAEAVATLVDGSVEEEQK